MYKAHHYVVVGGGLAGLTSAIELASTGLPVTVYEQSRTIGGRATTQRLEDFALNLGPHALYAGGIMKAQFDAWSIPYGGGRPVVGNGSFLIVNGAKIPFKLSFAGLLCSRAFTWRDKLCLGRILSRLQKAHVSASDSMAAWIDHAAESPRVRLFLAALTRLTTYSADLDLLSAAAALRQLHLALNRSVLYLDGGWQTVIDGLVRKAQRLGVEIRSSCGVVSVRSGELILHSNERIAAKGIVLALPPHAAERVTGKLLPRRIAARAACLDLGLRRVPPGAGSFALGLDEPAYFSVHSEYARGLAPDGGALVHVAMQLKRGESCKREALERCADLIAPGWRKEVVVARFLPQMTVMHAFPMANGPQITTNALRLPGVMLAGDWVGSEAMLADNAVASGLAAARAVRR